MNNINGFQELFNIYKKYYMSTNVNTVEISAQTIKNLHTKTGVALMECKQALQINNWNFELAFDYLSKKGLVKIVEDRCTKRLNNCEKQIQPNIFLGGWIFVKQNFCTEVGHIESATFYIPKSVDENEKMVESNKYIPWLEFQTLVDIFRNKLTHHILATNFELIEAIVHYYEHDDFLD